MIYQQYLKRGLLMRRAVGARAGASSTMLRDRGVAGLHHRGMRDGSYGRNGEACGRVGHASVPPFARH
eukprot:11191616-Lingulodinium_polyedra.AAC.1